MIKKYFKIIFASIISTVVVMTILAIMLFPIFLFLITESPWWLLLVFITMPVVFWIMDVIRKW